VARLRCEVAYGGPEGQWLLVLELDEGATVGDAIAASGLAALVPGLQVDDTNVGVFSQRRALRDALRHGDRVEIYRPLLADPKETRRARAQRERRKR
jgi:putative ubiquitin-RnfH superfamily antitoxin RatB of RatAB toxin-antitoxin module